MTVDDSKTLLEGQFPVKQLNRVAMMQSNSKMPIYQIHKWWARRLGSVFRSLIISSFLKQGSNKFWDNYYDGFLLNNKIIYDPFMGGGTTVIEALRLGCKVIGCDINPVAWFVTKKEIDPFDANEADKYFAELQEYVGEKIRSLYATECKKGHAAEVIYCIWIRQIHCQKCKKDYDLFNNYVIRQKHDVRTIFCPKCKNIFSTKRKGSRVVCNNCKRPLNLGSTPVKKGMFECPKCQTSEPIVEAVKKKQGPLSARMICIEYLCSDCGRDYKKPTKSDITLFDTAAASFTGLKDKLEYPTQEIQIHRKTEKRPLSHGFRRYYQLFNERQLLCLSILLERIKQIPDQNMREFFLLVLSSTLETNNVLCKYETNWGKISALFGVPAYHVPERFGENNLWGQGRGTFPRNYEKLKRGKMYGIEPFERIYDSKLDKRNTIKKQVGLSILAETKHESFDFHSNNWRVKIECGDSKFAEFIPKKSIDAVVTDPPYFDTISYSELADFFYVWLRLGLEGHYSFFDKQTSQPEEEATVYDSVEGTEFVKKLTDIMTDIKRVLKDDGLFVFTFHHSKTWAWRGLRKAILDSGFYVTAAPVIRSEGKTGFRKGNNSSYDVCVVCRKRDDHQQLPGLKSPLAVRNYIGEISAMKHLGPIKSAEIFNIIMSKYLMIDDVSAEKIVKDAPLLVARITEKCT